MFPSSIPHYIIWFDKFYLLVRILVGIHLLKISMNCRWVHQPPPHPLLALMMNSWFRTCFHSSFPDHLTMSSCQFELHLFFSGILSLRNPDTHQIWISIKYDGWNIFPRDITLVFNPIRWCHPNTPARRAYCYSFLFSKVSHSSMRKL